MAYLQAFGAVHKTGIYSHHTGVLPLDENQASLDIRRDQVYNQPHPGFGKLNAPDKMAFCAASLLLRDNTGYSGDTTGISLGTTTGSLCTDMRYAESLAQGFPRPGYFSATLPSSPVAEVAILFRLKGPDRIVADKEHAGFWALDNALRIISGKKADAVVVILTHAIEPQDYGRISIPLASSAYGFAFLLTKGRSPNGLNYTITLEENRAVISENPLYNDEESYFLAMVRALVKRESFQGPYMLYQSLFNINLQKEQ